MASTAVRRACAVGQPWPHNGQDRSSSPRAASVACPAACNRCSGPAAISYSWAASHAARSQVDRFASAAANCSGLGTGSSANRDFSASTTTRRRTWSACCSSTRLSAARRSACCESVHSASGNNFAMGRTEREAPQRANASCATAFQASRIPASRCRAPSARFRSVSAWVRSRSISARIVRRRSVRRVMIALHRSSRVCTIGNASFARWARPHSSSTYRRATF